MLRHLSTFRNGCRSGQSLKCESGILRKSGQIFNLPSWSLWVHVNAGARDYFRRIDKPETRAISGLIFFF